MKIDSSGSREHSLRQIEPSNGHTKRSSFKTHSQDELRRLNRLSRRGRSMPAASVARCAASVAGRAASVSTASATATWAGSVSAASVTAPTCRQSSSLLTLTTGISCAMSLSSSSKDLRSRPDCWRRRRSAAGRCAGSQLELEEDDTEETGLRRDNTPYPRKDA